MTISLTATQTASLTSLRSELLNATPKKLEELAAALLASQLGVPLPIAQSGYQHGGDSGTAGSQQRRLRVEAKRYADTSLNERELLGELDQALARDPGLEAWVLVATRAVPEQVAQSLTQHGEEHGVPVLILGWEETGLPELAALCALHPDFVSQIISQTAESHARALAGIAGPVVEQVERNLQSWALGFEALRLRSHVQLMELWERPKVAVAQLGQNAAGGAVAGKVRRASVYAALSGWWEGRAHEDAPAILHGYGGVGKTWAALDWLVDHRQTQPVVLVVPSSAAAGLRQPSILTLKQFIAERLYELTEVRNAQHWLQRVERLLKRPAAEGPAITVLLDGINQEPAVGWLNILKSLQAPPFENRIRLIASTRPLHLDNGLAHLRGLVVPPVEVAVEPYDLSEGGEFDQMLAFECLTRADLHPDLIELARTPRLFSLVVKLRDRLSDAGQVTIHRLLWEYGRDTLGIRAGRSFSEQEWAEWLATIANSYIAGIREFSVGALGQTTARPDLTEADVAARLSDIIDGRLAQRMPSGQLRLIPQVVSHALAVALLNHLAEAAPSDIAAAGSILDEWLDPISGLDEKSEILRATVSIVVAQEAATDTPAVSALVTSWLQSQNLPDSHRLEVERLGPDIAIALLDVIERSQGQAQASARLCAVQAIRSFNGSSPTALSILTERLTRWVSLVSRGVSQLQERDENLAKQRREFFEARIGEERSGRLRILGVEIELVEFNDEALAELAATLLQGAPLASAINVFEACAVRRTVERGDTIWRAFTWLCDLNEVDRSETSARLRELSIDMRSRQPEPGIHGDLAARAASALLWLAGDEEDENEAAVLNPPLYRFYSYEEDYLPNPASSFFRLERRHAERTLLDKNLSIQRRVERVGDLWLDPTFIPPSEFVTELMQFARQIEPEALDRHGHNTVEDHHFERLEPALARCAPSELASIVRSKLYGLASVPDESRYWSAIRAPRGFILADAAAAKAARELRLAANYGEGGDSGSIEFEYTQLLAIELKGKPALVQSRTILESSRGYIPSEFEWLLESLSQDEADTLIQEYGSGSSRQRNNLLALLSFQAAALSDRAWDWGISLFEAADDNLRGLAYRVLWQADAERLGGHLISAGWTWGENGNAYVDHYGSQALVEASLSLPFEQVVDRIAPWQLMRAVLRRGEDAEETRLAASILDHIIRESVAVPDLGSVVTVDRETRRRFPFFYSVEPYALDTGNPAEDLRAALDSEQQHSRYRRAIETAAERIEGARRSGAKLYLADIEPDELAPIVKFGSELVDAWLEGMERQTSDFRRRVRLAEPAYLALCEAMLAIEPARGVALWQALRETTIARYTGEGGVDDTIHMLFRAPRCDLIDDLLRQLYDLAKCNTDAGLGDLALCASLNGRVDWLDRRIEEDQVSDVYWRQQRAIVIKGFTVGETVEEPEAWPEGKQSTTPARLRSEAARRRVIDAAARHWYRAFLAAPTADLAFAGWTLFLAAAGPTTASWQHDEFEAADQGAALRQVKLTHADLNDRELRRRIKRRGERLDETFIAHKITKALSPWFEGLA